MSFVDAHCHLGSTAFDKDRQEVLERMFAKGVNKGIMICCSEHDLLKACEIREKHPDLKLAIGIHPQDLETSYDQQRLTDLKDRISECHADMIGEIGLDYYSHPHTREKQKQFFIAQLEMARQLQLPVDIHSRKATADTQEILKNYDLKTIIHSYSGSLETARLYLNRGYYLSFGASVLFAKARRPAEVIAAIPLQRLLIETDAPYQSPLRDQRHEPADVLKIYEAISRIRKISIEELERQVENNFKEIFT